MGNLTRFPIFVLILVYEIQNDIISAFLGYAPVGTRNTLKLSECVVGVGFGAGNCSKGVLLGY